MPISLISMTNRPKKIKKSKKKILAREIPCFHPYIGCLLSFVQNLVTTVRYVLPRFYMYLLPCFMHRFR